MGSLHSASMQHRCIHTYVCHQFSRRTHQATAHKAWQLSVLSRTLRMLCFRGHSGNCTEEKGMHQLDYWRQQLSHVDGITPRIGKRSKAVHASARRKPMPNNPYRTHL